MLHCSHQIHPASYTLFWLTQIFNIFWTQAIHYHLLSSLCLKFLAPLESFVVPYKFQDAFLMSSSPALLSCSASVLSWSEHLCSATSFCHIVAAFEPTNNGLKSRNWVKLNLFSFKVSDVGYFVEQQESEYMLLSGGHSNSSISLWMPIIFSSLIALSWTSSTFICWWKTAMIDILVLFLVLQEKKKKH